MSFTLYGRFANDATFTKQRGVLLYDEELDKHLFYDHNYSAIVIPKDSPLLVSINATQQQQGAHNNQVSMLEHSRRQSEWALELLLVGCLGLNAAPSSLTSPAPQHADSDSAQQPNASTSSVNLSTLPPSPSRIQHCKDCVFTKHLPALFGTLQPTPLPPDPIPKIKLQYFHDIMAHITLLSTLPLYDTLLTLPCSPSPLSLEQPPPPSQIQ
jgi:hypothetical protein